jgi:hypothetical protein
MQAKPPASVGGYGYALFVAIGGFVLALCCSTPALACGASDQPYRIVQEVWPADGAKGVVRNGAIQVQLEFVYPSSRVTSTWEQPRVRLVHVDDGIEVVGRLDTTHYHSLQRFTWAPLELLAANTVYRLEVTTMPDHRDDIEGKTTSITTFETSEEIAPELKLLGELQVALRAEWVPVQNCWPCTCAPTSERRRALMADFTLPQVAGGFADYGYTAWLGQSDREPPVFDGPGSGETRLDADGQYLALAQQHSTNSAHDVVTTEVFPESVTCFNFNVWDAAGQAKNAQSICIPWSKFDAVLSTLDDAANGGLVDAVDGGSSDAASGGLVDLPDAGVSDDDDAGGPRSADASTYRSSKSNSRKPPSHSFGCAVGASSTAPDLFACLLIAAGLVGVRRLRRPPAQHRH